jgi:hypothetical protein
MVEKRNDPKAAATLPGIQVFPVDIATRTLNARTINPSGLAQPVTITKFPHSLQFGGFFFACAGNVGEAGQPEGWAVAKRPTFSTISSMVDLETCTNPGDLAMAAMRSVQWLLLAQFWT